MNSIHLHNRHFNVYLSSAQIAERIREMAKLIATDMAEKNPLFIGILNGSFIFAADLFRLFDFPCCISFVKVASYQGTQSTGAISPLLGLKEDIAGRHIVLLEDIIDTGLTIGYLLDELKKRNPASISIAALLFKKECLKIEVKPDYVGFEVPNRFLVGYGLDYDGYGRNLPHVYAEEERA